jgi:hypothetical protein
VIADGPPDDEDEEVESPDELVDEDVDPVAVWVDAAVVVVPIGPP